MDFNRTSLKAIKKVFPHINIIKYFFHFLIVYEKFKEIRTIR